VVKLLDKSRKVTVRVSPTDTVGQLRDRIVAAGLSVRGLVYSGQKMYTCPLDADETLGAFDLQPGIAIVCVPGATETETAAAAGAEAAAKAARTVAATVIQATTRRRAGTAAFELSLERVVKIQAWARGLNTRVQISLMVDLLNMEEEEAEQGGEDGEKEEEATEESPDGAAAEDSAADFSRRLQQEVVTTQRKAEAATAADRKYSEGQQALAVGDFTRAVASFEAGLSWARVAEGRGVILRPPFFVLCGESRMKYTGWA
jgi:hypothetical protein